MSLPHPASAPAATSAPVLVFGDDSSAFLGAVRSLGRKGLAVHGAGCGRETPAHASRYLAACHAVPLYRGDGAQWLARVRALVHEHGFALLVPTSDAALAQLSAHAEDLLPARCAVPSPAALDLFADKWATREAARALGIPVAEGMLLDGECGADEVIARLGLPLILKQRRSYARGASVQKSGVSLVTRPADLARRLPAPAGTIAETFIPGHCRGVSVLAERGAVLQAFQHRRLRQEHATGPSSWRLAEPLDPRLGDAVSRLVARAGYTGIAMFEFRCHADAEAFALLEVNPRPWGSIQLAMDAGADYVAALHGMIIEGKAPARRTDFPTGRQKMSLIGEWDALAQDWDTAGLAARLALAPRLAAFLASLARGEGFDSFASDDPEPFRRERAAVLARLGGKLRKLLPRAAAGAPA